MRENSNDHEEKLLDMFAQELSQEEITIPTILEQKIRERAKILRSKPHYARNICIIAAAIILVFTFSVRWIPGFAVYAAGIPGLDSIVEWMRGDKGISLAKDHGYDFIKEVTVEQDGYIFDIGNIFFDEDRLTLSIAASGPEIERMLQDGKFYQMNIGFKDFTHKVASQEGYSIDERRKKYIDIKAELTFQDGDVQKFLLKAPQFITLNAKFYTINNYSHVFEKEIDNIQIPFERNMIKESKRYTFNNEIDIKGGNFFEELLIKPMELCISPTRMRLDISMVVPEGYSITGLEKPYLLDQQGNIYKAEGLTMMGLSTDNQAYFFVPSTYFEIDYTKLFLCFDGVRIAKSEGQKFNIKLNDTYPKTIMYMGEKIIIKQVFYQDSKLSMVMDYPDPNILYIGHLGFNVEDAKVRQHSTQKVTLADGNRVETEHINSFEVEYKDEYEITIEYPGYLLKSSVKIPLALK